MRPMAAMTGWVLGMTILAAASHAAADPLGLTALQLFDNPFTKPNVIQADLVTQPGAIVHPIHVGELKIVQASPSIL